MNIKVRVYLGEKLIEPSELHKICIKCPSIDRIVNDIVDRNADRSEGAKKKVS